MPETYSTLEDLVAAERARRLGGQAATPPVHQDTNGDTSLDRVDVDDADVDVTDQEPSATPQRQPLGAVAAFVKEHADLTTTTPSLEAQRVYGLAVAAGLKTTTGSIGSAIRSLQHKLHPNATKQTLRAWVAAHADPTAGTYDEAARLLPLAEAAGFKTTIGSVRQSITVFKQRVSGDGPSSSQAKRKATMLARYGTANPAKAARIASQRGVRPAPAPSRRKAKRRQAPPNISQAEQAVAAEIARASSGSTSATQRWRQERRGEYRTAVAKAVEHDELDLLFAEVGIATLQASLKARE